jgi:hypothetical protein
LQSQKVEHKHVKGNKRWIAEKKKRQQWCR